MRSCLLFAVAALSLCGCALSEEVSSGTVYFEDEQFSFVPGVVDSNGVAFGTFDDTLNVTGWGVLRMTSSSLYGDTKQMYGLGFLEGVLSYQRIYEMLQSMNDVFFSSSNTSATNSNIPRSLIDFFNNQTVWTVQQITKYVPLDEDYELSLIQPSFVPSLLHHHRHHDKTNGAEDDPSVEEKQRVFTGVAGLLAQFNGLMAGYNYAVSISSSPSPPPLSFLDFSILNGVGDLLDLLSVVEPKQYGINYATMSPTKFEQVVFTRSLCSALIKIQPDYSDLFMSHSSWFTYSAMNRIYKFYTTNLHTKYLKASALQFSSYPGFLESLDDFYIMNSGLVMIQTTNNIFNTSLYSYVQPSSLFAWQRVRLANAFAIDGQDWYQLVKTFNSGTYNNQYMVVNYNLFVPSSPLVPNTLWVIEQIPGFVQGADVTRNLEQGYFASYNVPYFIDIYNKSGYPQMIKQFGLGSSYQLAPRAQLFRRDQSKVMDLSSLQYVMRSNNFQTDPISNHSATAAICARGDLTYPINNHNDEREEEEEPAGVFWQSMMRASASGCYDTKVTNNALRKQLVSFAINGPTLAGGNAGAELPAFSWSSAKFSSLPHFGQPDTFNFDFVKMAPNAS